jgi:hypothetical protein
MVFAYAYLLRVPIAAGLVIAALAPFALWKGSQVTTLLEGMFDLNWWRTMIATVMALLAASACAICSELVSGVADLLENVAILAAVDGPTPVVVGWLRRAAGTKWLMLGLTFVALGFGAWRRTLASGWEVVGFGIDVAYLWAGILCLVGVIVHEPVIERCALPLAAAVITQLAVAVFRPRPHGVPGGAPRSPSSHAA